MVIMVIVWRVKYLILQPALEPTEILSDVNMRRS